MPRLHLPAAVPFLLLAALPAVAEEPAAPAPAAPAAATEPAPAQPAGTSEKTDDISAAEVSTLLRQLKQMRQSLDSEERKTILAALTALNSATSGTTGAMTLWVESVRVVDFDRQNKKQTEFEEWRKKNDERMHDAAFCTGLLFQCKYLKLCLEADTPEKQARALPAIHALMTEAVAAMPKMLQYSGMLRDDAFSSTIAKRLGIEKLAPEGWPRALLRPEEHYGRAIAAARKGDAAAVTALWDARINLERSIAKANDENGKLRRRKEAKTQFGNRKDTRDAAEAELVDTKNAVAFEKDQLPKLQWAMGEDLYKAGLRRRGLETMFGVIHRNPRHASVSEWVDRITAIAEELSGEGKPAEAPAGEAQKKS